MKCFHLPAFMFLFNLKVKQTKSDLKNNKFTAWQTDQFSFDRLINESADRCGSAEASVVTELHSSQVVLLTSGVDQTLNVHRQTSEFRFRSSGCSERMYNHTSNQQLICPINTQSHWEPAGEARRGRGQSLLLGVFVTKINVSSGIKIDDNLYLS